MNLLTNIARTTEGYLKHLDDWNAEVATALAQEDDLHLTDAHWEVIHFLRKFYDKYQTSPAIRALVKALGKQLGLEKGNSLYLMTLFPAGPAKQANKIAGLPKPIRCI